MIGQTLAHYRILEELGRGGMGVVYKAHDTKLDRPAALKVLKPELLEDEEHRKRFLREARSAASVTHPFIASIYDAGEADGTLFIAMEFVEGQTLRSLLARGPMPIADAQQYATEIAEGLAKAHQAGLVHRDMKPDNVMIATDGHAKILDFGLAKVVEKRDEAATVTLGKAERAEVTTQGAILGTPAYMSPEQARGEPVDSRSDIFAFGSTVYEMVTGKAPFSGPTHQDTLASILRDEPLSPHDFNPAVPGELNRIISRCLHKKPENRYNDTRDLVVALQDLQTVTTTPKGLQPSPAQPSRRWGQIVVAIAALGAIVALAVVQPWKLVRRDEQNVTSSTEIPKRPNWILVADFEGPAQIALPARELVISSLASSRVVTPISSAEATRGLAQAMKPDTTRIIGEVARELAVRAAARTIVHGRVDRVFQGFTVVLTLLEAESGHILRSVNGVAENEEMLIPTLDRLSTELRLAIDKEGQTVQSTRPSIVAITPSFSAYLKYQESLFHAANVDYVSSIRLLHEALHLDPDFATAWMQLAIDYRNFSISGSGDMSAYVDSMRMAIDEARRRPERLTEEQRIRADYFRFGFVDRNLQEWKRVAELYTRTKPEEPGAHNGLAIVYVALGRFEDAWREYLIACDIAPFGPHPFHLYNQFRALMTLGRYKDATVLSKDLTGVPALEAKLKLHVAKHEWNQARHLAEGYLRNQASEDRVKHKALWALASVHAACGEIRAAADVLTQIRTNYGGVAPCFASAFLEEMSIGAISVSGTSGCDQARDSNSLLRGIKAAMSADTVEAWECWRDLNRNRDSEDVHTEARLLRGWIAASECQWEKVVQLLEPATTQGLDRFIGRHFIQWVVARAFENLEDTDSAVRLYELAASTVSYNKEEESGLPYSFAHHRLVLLYSKMGRVEDAKRHWEIFERTFMNPDPELVPMIEEARQALAQAEARAAS